MQYYIGVIHKDPESDYGISFPDFPGCVSAGANLAEALAMGREALAGHVGVMVDEGEAVPEPSPIDALRAEIDESEGIAVMVPVALPSARAVRVNITLPEDALRAIDAYAEQHGFTRSGFLATAAKRAMAAA